MSWRVVVRPEAESDVIEAATWYDARREGLGNEFVEEVLRAFDELAVNPLLNCRRYPCKNIRWRYPDRFPYRVVYEVLEADYPCSLPPCFMPPGTTGIGRDVSKPQLFS